LQLYIFVNDFVIPTLQPSCQKQATCS